VIRFVLGAVTGVLLAAWLAQAQTAWNGVAVSTSENYVLTAVGKFTAEGEKALRAIVRSECRR